MPSPASRPRLVVLALALVAATNVLANAVGWQPVATASQWLLIPTLTAAFLALPPTGRTPLPRLRTATLVALAFSWLGDVVPDVVPESVAFLAMVGCFLLAQVAFIVAFARHWQRSVLGRDRRLVMPYAAACLALLLACAPAAGSLAVPVVVYGLMLTTMAVLATGLGPLTTAGGILFMISDSLIALGAFRGWEGRASATAVMATYALAELLLVFGVQRFRREAPPTGAARVGTTPAPRHTGPEQGATDDGHGQRS